MIPKGNGFVKWGVLAPVLLGIVIACLGSSAYLVERSEDSIHESIRLIQTDLREIRNDVKDLLKKVR